MEAEIRRWIERFFRRIEYARLKDLIEYVAENTNLPVENIKEVVEQMEDEGILRIEVFYVKEIGEDEVEP